MLYIWMLFVERKKSYRTPNLREKAYDSRKIKMVYILFRYIFVESFMHTKPKVDPIYFDLTKFFLILFCK